MYGNRRSLWEGGRLCYCQVIDIIRPLFYCVLVISRSIFLKSPDRSLVVKRGRKVGGWSICIQHIVTRQLALTTVLLLAFVYR